MQFSRFSHHKKEVLVKRSLVFFASGTVILLIYIFLVLPFFTRLLMRRSIQTKLPLATPSVQITPPILTLPFDATNSAQVTIKGSGAPSLKVYLGVNGSLDLDTKASDKGDFTFPVVTLTNGENILQAYAEDDQGNRSDGSEVLKITLITDAPVLEISEPQDGLLVTQRKQSVVSVKGKTDPGNKVYLQNQFLFVASDGLFSGSYQLQQGDNLLQIKSVNSGGNESLKEINVKYLP